MSELFLTFILLGVIILVQFLILDSHLDQIEKKIDKLKEDKDEQIHRDV